MGEELLSINSHSTQFLEFDAPSREDTPYTLHDVDRLKRHLRFYFMTPCEKYKARGRKPWKLAVQLLKIVIVTIQVYTLGTQRSNFVDFKHTTTLSLKHIMFKKWDPAYETMPYPAAIGKYALYKTTELIDHLNYAMFMYNQTENLAIGAYGFTPAQALLKSKTATLSLIKFQVGKIFPRNATYYLNPHLDRESLDFTDVKSLNGSDVYDIETLLAQRNLTLSVNKLHSIELNFVLNGIHLKQGKQKLKVEPDCLQINVTIVYDNSDHDGQIMVNMKLDLLHMKCNDGSRFIEDVALHTGLTIFIDAFVVVLCAISFFTCTRSVMKSTKLYRKIKLFLMKHFDYKCKTDDMMLFVNLWYIMIIISDILAVIGTGLKIAISMQKYEYYDYSTLLLGITTVLVWMGVIRYFEYFRKYNVLVLTCKKALPDVLRFLICAAIFYIAFTICGWLVLGPYHLKFKTIATSSECLFSLVNGDDMFVTFSVIDGKVPSSIWIFSRVYLYSFISLFIYFVLNVFISVIIDTYEVVKMHYAEGFPKTFVQKFYESCNDDPSSSLYISDMHSSSCCCCLFSCRKREHTDDSTNILT